MASTERPREVWERVAADLRAFKTAQQQTWGGLDDLTVARVLAGTATPDENQRVAATAAGNPAVAELLAIVRGVFGDPAHGMSVTEAASIKKVPESTLRAAVERGELPVVPTQDGYTITAEALAGWKPTPPKPMGGRHVLAASTGAASPVRPVVALAAPTVGHSLVEEASAKSEDVARQWVSWLVSVHLIPFLRRANGDAVADAVASLTSWLDGKVVLARQTVILASHLFTDRIHAIQATYKKTSPTTATVETVSTLRVGENVGRRLTFKEEEVPFDELPEEIRTQLIQNPATQIGLDLKMVIWQAVVRKGAEVGVTAEELTLAH